MDAESYYAFRHALVREGAYQLLPPEQRSRLHELAMQSLEDLFADALDPVAHELADHAALARGEWQEDNDSSARLKRLAAAETGYLRRAARYAQQAYRMEESIRLWDRLAAHPALDDNARLEAIDRSATARLQGGRLQEAEQLLREAISRNEEAPSVPGLRVSLGAVLYNMAKLPEALRQYELALPALEAEGPTADQARLWVNLAGAREMLGEIALVEESLLRGEQLARQLGNRGLEAQIIGNLANYYHRRDDWVQAKRDYLRSLDLALELNDLRQEAAVCNGLGVGYFEHGEPAIATEYLARAVDSARRANDRYKLGEALVNLAAIAGADDRPEATLPLHDEALEIHRETGNVWGEAAALIGKSDVYLHGGDLAAAREALLEARRLSASVRDKDREGVALLRLALVEIEAGQAAQAQEYWSVGRTLLENSRMHRDALHDDMLGACKRKGVPPLKDDRRT
ncbi:MAG: hypothetical protein KDB82_08025 [Planctomycetes bacterium]|nr:hypothetical protein [Planctomycetota bacterium]